MWVALSKLDRPVGSARGVAGSMSFGRPLVHPNGNKKTSVLWVGKMQIPSDDGAKFDAYVSTKGPGAKPGLIICTEAFGVNSHMRSVADRFAELGYLVIVPDLLWRIEPNLEIAYNEAGLKRGSEIAEAFDKDQGAADLRQTVTAMRQRYDCNGRIGVMGFCIGGAMAFGLAGARSDVNAFVSYYGKGIEEYLNEASAISCPGILHYGGADRFIPQPVVAEIRKALAFKPNIEIFDYPGVDHGFNSEDRRAFNPEVAQTAMRRTLGLFEQALKH